MWEEKNDQGTRKKKIFLQVICLARVCLKEDVKNPKGILGDLTQATPRQEGIQITPTLL
jgi:hypothetical protein